MTPNPQVPGPFGQPTPMPAGGTQPAPSSWYYADPSNPTQWASDIIGEAGGPTSGAGYQGDLSFLTGWYDKEGGNWENTASYNPLNTTQAEPGYSETGTQGNIGAYTSWAQGNQATLQTLAKYPDILNALKSGTALTADESGQFANELGGHPGTWSYSSASDPGYTTIAPGQVNASQLIGGATPPANLASAPTTTPGSTGEQQSLQSILGNLLQDTSALSAEQNVGLGAEQILGQGQQGITDTELQQQLQDTLLSLGLQGQQLGVQGTQLGQQQQYQAGQYGLEQQQDVLSQQGLNLQKTQAGENAAGSGTYNSGALSQALQSIGLQQGQLGLTEKGQTESNTYQVQQIQDALQRLGISKQQLGLQGTVAQQEYGTGTEQAANTYANLANQIQMQEQLNTQGNSSGLQGLLDQLYTSGGFTG